MEVVASGNGFFCKVELEVNQSIEGNSSAVHLTRLQFRQTSGYDEVWAEGTVALGSTTLANLELTNIEGHGVNLTSSWSGFSYNGGTATVYHNDDGTAASALTVSIGFYTRQGHEFIGGVFTSVTAELPVIPRVSGISAAGVTLGTVMTISLSRAAASFTDTVQWFCGSLSGTVVSGTALSSVAWTPPVSLAEQAPNSMAVNVTLRVITYSGGTQIGYRDIGVVCSCPAYSPTVGFSVSDDTGYASSYGGYIQNQSRARVTVTAAGVWGSTVAAVKIWVGSLSQTGSSGVFALPNSGAVGIRVEVTDSRGAAASASGQISVLAWQAPQAVVTDAFRCNSDGTRNPAGEWGCLVFDADVTQVSGGTTAYYAVVRRHGTQEVRNLLLTDYSGAFLVRGGSVLFTAGVNDRFDCCIRTADVFAASESAEAVVGSAFFLLDFDRGNQGIGIGVRAKRGHALSIGVPVVLEETAIQNLADPVNASDAATKGYVDAVVAALASAGGISWQ